MEVILKGTEGVPEGSVLSLKFGGIKRQAPASKIGQCFKFASSPAEPLPLDAEILVPACAPQSVKFDVLEENIVVNFGAMKVMLQQRALKDAEADPSRPPVDITSEAKARGLPADKVATAQRAASYLEKHGLVTTFQEILHGLLLTTPDDPHRYVEEQIARVKKLAAAQQAKGGEEADTLGPPPPRRGNNAAARGSVRESMRSTVGSRNKVDTLILTLSSCKDNLPLILPFLPESLQVELGSKELMEECINQFKKLDKQNQGRLEPDDLMPVIVHLSGARLNSIGSDQCRKFFSMFDIDDDGLVDAQEFVMLVQFVMVASFLESDEGKATLETAQCEEKYFQNFLQMVEQDRERLWSLIPFLPDWLVEHITSEQFQQACNEQFDSLDKSRTGALGPVELIDIVRSLSEAHPLSIDHNKCQQFIGLFDIYGNGVIMRDEFVEFAQFLTVMNFLSNTAEGQEVKSMLNETSKDKITRLINTLEQRKEDMATVLHSLPGFLVNEITSDSFKQACMDGFAALDKDGNGVLDKKELFEVVIALSESRPYQVDKAQCERFASIFDKDKNGVICKEEFVELTRFITVMSYLDYALAHAEMDAAEVLLGEKKIGQLLEIMKTGVEQVVEVAPFLPKELLDEMQSAEFIAQCEQDFKALDKDGSGVLESNELIPIILELSQAHHFALTEEHCKKFVNLFDYKANGVITAPEFLNFTRFMMVMAFMETEEGLYVQYDMEVAKRQTSSNVQEVLHMLEQDRKAVYKVIPLLPKEIYEELTSNEFVMSCHEQFIQLDKAGNNALSPQDLISVVAELIGCTHIHINVEQCKRFVKIFDVYGDGVLRPEEFLDFSRFLCIMSYINTEEGKAACADAVRIIHDSKKVDDLIRTMEMDRQQLHKVIPYLPDSVRNDLNSEHFTVECLAFFKELDKDGNGSLDATELYPMVLSLSNAHECSLDLDQCRQFMAIFDDAKTGVISMSEFVDFARFLIIMAWLRSHEHEDVSCNMVDKTEIRDIPRPEAPGPEPRMPSNAAVPPPAAPQKPPSPSLPAHLAVDCDYYRDRSEKLAAENETLRARCSSMEQLVKTLQDKVADQDRRLRHAEVDLRRAGL